MIKVTTIALKDAETYALKEIFERNCKATSHAAILNSQKEALELVVKTVNEAYQMGREDNA
ncbi:MAG: hypothetical protein HRU18_06855 [Pseudoalteromonas sp.]|uniref:hypothetical protein n=1 Tax=Pseudoalteromonas sp. TaxID=53249 RepID=UPI001D758BE9|nr:hypothetical protein [Pseudoalteromonas sp.]NRA77910.1 hypothetical protein [Pseudoalteromonas sp.]